MRPIGTLTVVALLLSGCSFVLDFGEFTTGERDGGGSLDGGGTDAGDAGAGEDAGDGSTPDACVATGDETCNGADDDCDGEIDEDAAPPDDPDNCGGCGIACGPESACISGTCGSEIVEIVGGTAHTCARSYAGDLFCWGENAQGQVGTGGVGGTEAEPLLVVMPGDARVSEIGAGGGHSCAITGGATYCWGETRDGQLGNGLSDARSPADADALADAPGSIAVAGGDLHTCLLTATGRVRCAGDNGSGQVGGSDPRIVRFDTTVGALSDVVDVTAGGAHSCAARADGSVWCWGQNDQYQLGKETPGTTGEPQEVVGPSGVVEVEAGQYHTCARSGEGAVWCWGDGDATPGVVDLPAGMGAIDLAAGQGFTCAVLADHRVFCWGAGELGQLGNGAAANSPTPVEVADLWPATAVGAGRAHACAALRGHGLRCWGVNEQGQLGIGAPGDIRPLPQDVDLP